MSVRALMYHDVVEAGDIYSVSPRRFGEHLDRMAAATGDPPVRGDAPTGGDGWMLTFDDGGESAIAAGEELARRSWPGHFFITTDMVGTPGFVDWDGVRALVEMGHVVGSHSCSHPDRMATCSWDELLDEWGRSKEVLEAELGAPVPTASVPGGLYSREVGRAAAASGYTTLFTSLPSRRLGSVDGCRTIGRFAIRRDTSAEEAAAAAAGSSKPWLRQRVAWDLRGAAKRIGGERYESLRRTLLARRGSA